MPHRKLARRCEPRYGVNLPMLQAEAKWLAREFDDLLIGSTNDLHERLDRSHQNLLAADAGIQLQIRSLPDPESLALRCLLARDLYHLSALYEQFLQSYDGRKKLASPALSEPVAVPAPPTTQDAVTSTFKEWLFDS